MADILDPQKRNFVRYDRSLQQVWVLNQRLHHGAVGIIVIATGAILALHDRKDWREWFKRASFAPLTYLIIDESDDSSSNL